MKPPKPLSAAQLRHPKDKRSKFNGQKWRNEKRDSFNSRVSSVEGTKQPSNARPITKAHLTPDGHVAGSRDVTGKVKPVPDGCVLRPAFVHDRVDLQGLKQHQQKMLHSKKQ